MYLINFYWEDQYVRQGQEEMAKISNFTMVVKMIHFLRERRGGGGLEIEKANMLMYFL